MKLKCISQEGLKIIACLTMLIDHIGATVIPLPELRMIGRLAFPIFCYLLVEGVHHTRKPLHYVIRLALGALLSELPFDLLFSGRFTWESQSVMLTLLLGFGMVYLMSRAEKQMYKLLYILPFAFAADLLKTDYAGYGILVIAVFALTRHMRGSIALQTLLLAWLFWGMNSIPVTLFGIQFPIQLLGVAAMLPIWLYSGRKSTASKVVQWGFYLFYPLHILLLYFLK